MNESLDTTMKAISHPARRGMLERLTHGELTITDLAEPFEMSLNAVSKHIQVLERAGLITRRRVWREHRVSFNPKPLDDVSKWIEERRRYWAEQLDALDELLQVQDAVAGLEEEV